MSMLIQTASSLGRHHRTHEINCQDAWAVQNGTRPNGKRYVVACVSDGCGSGSHSEIGAHLLVNVLCSQAAKRLEHGEQAQNLPLSLLRKAAQQLENYTKMVCGSNDPYQRTQFVARYLLATLIVLIHDQDHVVIFAQGDGLAVLNDEIISFEQNNEPAYLAYSLLGKQIPWLSALVIRPAHEVQRAAISTDGLPPELVPDVWGHRGRSLQRWLNVKTREMPLQDDTTLAVLEHTMTKEPS
jgi:hypothetical protein